MSARAPMHVGLNLVYLVPGETGGMETYARQLIPALVAAAPEHRFTAFVSDAAWRTPGPWSELVGAVRVPVDPRNRIEWVRGEQQRLPPLAQRAGVQLLHSFASTSPAWGHFRRVVTIHDLIYRTVPEAHPGLRSLGMRALVPLGARRADRVIADSHSTASDLRTYLHIDPRRIDVAPLGVGAPRGIPEPESAVRARLDAGERPIVLSVSAKLAHKNLLRLIGALARLEESERPLLVLPGYPTPHEAQLRARAAELGLEGDVRFPGWVSAAQLEGLYAAAAAFVFPTLAEGFGLPVLEAMVRGVPVACSDIPVLAEVAGQAALRFDPRSEEAIAAAVSRLLDDPPVAARLAAAGPAWAAQFSWRRTADATLASYARISVPPG
jgi:glycosyltransferase involved in cell wall biosynthesis